MPTILEIIAVTFSMLSVWYTVKKNMLMWPTGIVGIVAFFFVFTDARLYSDALLQVIFLMLNLGGWLVWRVEERMERAIYHLDHRVWILLVLGVVLSMGVGNVMKAQTLAALPHWDAAILVFSVMAQVLLMLRTFEHWYFWIIVNVISIFVYFSRGLYLTSAEYCVFLILSIIGLYTWEKESHV